MAKASETIAKAAAETTTAVNTLVGIRRSEFLKSLGVMAGHAARQPKPFARHLSNYGKELLNIAKGESELAPHRKDRRFKDETWQKKPAL
jgi:polyhydroxyalkanoate synthase